MKCEYYFECGHLSHKSIFDESPTNVFLTDINRWTTCLTCGRTTRIAKIIEYGISGESTARMQIKNT